MPVCEICETEWDNPFVVCPKCRQDLISITKPKELKFDNINHPKHYNSHPSGIEAIQITEYMNFCLGNAIKYILRHEHKGGTEDLRKAIWYLEREIKRLENTVE